MAKEILPLFPLHRIYCEPFIGGGVLYFSKHPSEVEVINDKNEDVFNFYRTIQVDFERLSAEIGSTLHSSVLFERAQEIFFRKVPSTPLSRAWAFWAVNEMSYFQISGGFSYLKNGSNKARLVNNKRKLFNEKVEKRLRDTKVLLGDALDVIATYDAEDAFFYLDPPYIDTAQSHYEGYTKEDYDALLSLLSTLKGKFLLSSFVSETLKIASKRYGWHTIHFAKHKKLFNTERKTKIEVLTGNFLMTNDLLR